MKTEGIINDLQLSEHEEFELTEDSEDDTFDKMDFNERLSLPKELRRMFWMKIPDEDQDKKKDNKQKEKVKKENVQKFNKDKY